MGICEFLERTLRVLKIMVYTDGKPVAASALRFSAGLAARLSAEMAVGTVRPGTYAAEEPPPLGVEFPFSRQQDLPVGIQILVQAAELLTEEGFLRPQANLTIRDVPNGHIFVGTTLSGQRVPFYELFGPFIDVLNHEVAERHYNLLVIAAPRRSTFDRFAMGNPTRKLALDLHSSMLVVRGGRLDGRLLVCTDGSPSARRQFPMLRDLLPALTQPVELVCVQKSSAPEDEVRQADECLQHAQSWLANCGKNAVVHKLKGDRPLELILESAGNDSVIMMGASLRHDLYRHTRGSLCMQVLAQTESSVLLVNLPPEADTDYFKDPFTC
jgi:nucleotide-binding universal stress UspA family protein